MEMGSFIHWITKEFPGKVYFYLVTDAATLGLSPKDSHLLDRHDPIILNFDKTTNWADV